MIIRNEQFNLMYLSPKIKLIESSDKTWSNELKSMGETNRVKKWKIDTLNMTDWTWQVMTTSHEVQSTEKAKHGRIIHLV